MLLSFVNKLTNVFEFGILKLVAIHCLNSINSNMFECIECSHHPHILLAEQKMFVYKLELSEPLKEFAKNLLSMRLEYLTSNYKAAEPLQTHNIVKWHAMCTLN